MENYLIIYTKWCQEYINTVTYDLQFDTMLHYTVYARILSYISAYCFQTYLYMTTVYIHKTSMVYLVKLSLEYSFRDTAITKRFFELKWPRAHTVSPNNCFMFQLCPII